MQHGAEDKKLTYKIQASYTLKGTILQNVESIKYLTSTNDFEWNMHISNFALRPKEHLGS